jgi:hypothetical protein
MTNFYGLSRSTIQSQLKSGKAILTGDYYMLSYDYGDDLIMNFFFDEKTEECIAVCYVMPIEKLDFAKLKLSSEYPNKNENLLEWWSKNEKAKIKILENKKSLIVSYYPIRL